MKQVCGLAVLTAVLLGASVGRTTGADDEKKDDAPSIKMIMTKAHKGGDSILSKLKGELGGDDTDWGEVSKLSKELVKLGTDLGKAKPPKGEAKSWEKLTNAYKANAVALEKAAGKKDQKAAVAAFEKLSSVKGTCQACHKVHKGK